jgi:hypothetical protein
MFAIESPTTGGAEAIFGHEIRSVAKPRYNLIPQLNAKVSALPRLVLRGPWRR